MTQRNTLIPHLMLRRSTLSHNVDDFSNFSQYAVDAINAHRGGSDWRRDLQLIDEYVLRSPNSLYGVRHLYIK